MTLNNVPEFPNFKPVTLGDKAVFEFFSTQFEPFADYNFNNFYSWDTESIHSFTTLNDNLVLKFADFVSGKPFVSFIGTSKVEDTALTLLAYAKENNLETYLKLIPEVTATHLSDLKKLRVTEDLESNDYVFSIEEISHMSGRHYKNKRQAANKCQQRYNIKIVDRSDDANAYEEAAILLHEWKRSKLDNSKEVDMEYEQFAIKRMLEISAPDKNVILTFAYSNHKPVAFSVDEFLTDTYVISHYFKTLPEYYGLTEYLNQNVAKKIYEKGYHWWNWQQDLGIESLRKMKLGYRPKKLLKKYIVEAN